jgi:hypothetical protein
VAGTGRRINHLPGRFDEGQVTNSHTACTATENFGARRDPAGSTGALLARRLRRPGNSVLKSSPASTAISRTISRRSNARPHFRASLVSNPGRHLVFRSSTSTSASNSPYTSRLWTTSLKFCNITARWDRPREDHAEREVRRARQARGASVACRAYQVRRDLRVELDQWARLGHSDERDQRHRHCPCRCSPGSRSKSKPSSAIYKCSFSE